jgi:hypothetical protein
MNVEGDARQVPLRRSTEGEGRGQGTDKVGGARGGGSGGSVTGGKNGREEKSIGIDTCRAEDLARVRPIELWRLTKQAACMNLN